MHVLVVDDMPIFREPIEAVLRAEGFRTSAAGDGAAALTLAKSDPPDLVLLDLTMPGMDGVEVLRQLRAAPATRSVPVIILSASAEKSKIVEAAACGISGYLLKTSFSLRDMLTRIRAVLNAGQSAAATPVTPSTQLSAPAPGRSTKPGREAASAPSPAAAAPGKHTATPSTQAAHAEPAESAAQLKPIMTRAALLERLRSFEDLKGFSPSVTQVLHLTSSDRTPVEAIARAISIDQAMALKILKLSNSSLYTSGDRVDTVHKAVLRIGLTNIRQAVLNIAVVERFSSAAFRERISTQHFWEHSIACGIIASNLSRTLRAGDSDTAFTAGLLHDLGRVILAEALGDDYLRIVEEASRLDMPIEQVETRLLSLNHADIMEQLLTRWKFPRDLVEPVMHHHLAAGNARNVSPTRAPEILRIGLANRLAHAMMLGNSGNEIIYPIEAHCHALRLPAEVLRNIESNAIRQTDEAKFAMLTASQSGAWARRSDQLREQLGVPFRPVNISADPDFDAFAIFCRQLADPMDDAPPNIAVVSISDARSRDIVAERLPADARLKASPTMPLLVITGSDSLSLPPAAVRDRPTARLRAPVAITKFLSVARSLLAGEEARAAA